MDACHCLQHLCSKSPLLAPPNMFNIPGYHKIQFMTICFTHKHQKTGLGMSFSIDFFDFSRTEINHSSSFEAANNFDFLARKISNYISDLLKLVKFLVEVSCIKSLKNRKWTYGCPAVATQAARTLLGTTCTMEELA